MSWSDPHRVSENLASAAHDALRRGDNGAAQSLFAQAAKAEEEALLQLDPTAKPRTFSIMAVSAAALWYKGHELERAESITHRILCHSNLEAFAASQLRTLLQAIWNVRAQEAAGIRFIPGQVQVSVRGGEVVTGGAPLDLIVEKVQTIQSMFYRTTEFLKQMPLRRHGPASKEIQETCRPWLFQGVPASYQFVVAIQRPPQTDWVTPDDFTSPELVASTFLSILKNAVDDPKEGLSRVVPDREYRSAFLRLTRSLTPTGKMFSQMEVRAAGDFAPVVLVPESRKLIAQTLKAEAPPTSVDMTPAIVKGVLRAVHLNKDWLEVTLEDGTDVRVLNVGEALDDVIGPMVNHPVTVQALKDQKGKLHFRDIEREE
jgi:hypothetical protein